MTLYRGIDLHANNSLVATIDEEDDTRLEKRLPNSLDAILSALSAFATVQNAAQVIEGPGQGQVRHVDGQCACGNNGCTEEQDRATRRRKRAIHAVA